MTTDTPLPDNASVKSSSVSPPESDTRLSIKRVLTAVVCVLVIGGAALGGWWYFTNREPTLFPVTGVVTLDGEPMVRGLVTTKYVDRKLLGGLAQTDEHGHFELRTNGKPGIYEGDHKIMVTLTTGGMPPASLIPESYSSHTETPFSITVTQETQSSPLKLEVTGGREVPDRPAGGMRYPAFGSDGEPNAPDDPETPAAANESSDQNVEARDDAS